MLPVASLPWYFFRPIEHHYKVFWARLRDILIEEEDFRSERVPEALSDASDFRRHWANPDLLLCQCCGYHIATKARDLKVVAAPAFDVDDVSPGKYRSVIVKKKGASGDEFLDFREGVVAFNEDQSYSGYTALLSTIPEEHLHKGFFSKKLRTESHLESLKRIISGDADIAAIDEITYEIILDHFEEFKGQFDIIKKTDEAMAPPYVTSSRRSDDEIKSIRDALFKLPYHGGNTLDSALESMKIRGIVDATNEDYLPMASQIQNVEAMVRNVWGNERGERD